MLLPYGKKGSRWIHISEVPSGQTGLHCPYCEELLLAKKGKRNAHHFAHVGYSCMRTGSASLLDLGKKLPTQLAITDYVKRKQQSIVQQLGRLQKKQAILQKRNEKQQQLIKTLVQYLKAEQNRTVSRALVAHIRYEFNPLPDLSYLTTSFAVHIKAARYYHVTQQQLAEMTTKLELYKEELAWFQRFQVYFLEIRTSPYSVFYKIGLTARTVSERVQEIRQDLRQFPNLDIKVCYVLQGVAFLETFFKQKYRSHRHDLEQHTEYFVFEYYEIAAIKQQLKKLGEE